MTEPRLLGRALAGVVALVLVACTPTPGEPPTEPEPWPTLGSDTFVEWLEDQPGVTAAKPGPPEFPGRAVKAESLEAARAFADALHERHETDPTDTDPVGVHLDVDGGTSIVRVQPGQTPDEVWELLDDPLLGGATTRLIGSDTVGPRDPHHMGLQESFARTVLYYGGDVLDVVDQAQTIRGYRVVIFSRGYSEPHGGLTLGSLDHYDNSTLEDLGPLAADLRVLREAGVEPVENVHDLLKFGSREDVLTAAAALPQDTTFSLLSHEGVPLSLAPEGYEFFEYTSPTREETIAWFTAHPDVEGGTGVSGLEVGLADEAACDAFLADPPAWETSIDLRCQLDGGSSFGVHRPLPDLLTVAPIAREAAEILQGRVTVMEHPAILVRTGPDLDRWIPGMEKIREIGWNGEMEIHLTDHSTGDRGAKIELSSTSDGEGTVTSTRPGGLDEGEQRLVKAWQASAG